MCVDSTAVVKNRLEPGHICRGAHGPDRTLKPDGAEAAAMEAVDVVTVFLRHEGAVLLQRRAASARTYPGVWGGVSGYVEGDDPLGTARREVAEETGIDDAEVLGGGDPLAVEDMALGRVWTVHPFLFEAPSRSVSPSAESDRTEWAPPTAILRRETVPGLWAAYRRVGPTAASVAADTEHGSAALSIRALEALRDAAGEVAAGHGEPADVVTAAEALLEARPAMAAVTNRLNRAMATAADPEGIERAAIAGIDRAVEADREAAAVAAERLDGARVLTLSRSGTVLEALEAGASSVTVAESRPALEGIGAAEVLAGLGIDVRVCTDAAVADQLARGDIDWVVVGADTVLPDGRVVNKTGTRAAALAADFEAVPVMVVAAADKVSTEPDPRLEAGDPAAVYGGDAGVTAVNPTFDVTPTGCVDSVVTERGPLDAAGIASVAAEHRERAAWRIDRDRDH